MTNKQAYAGLLERLRRREEYGPQYGSGWISSDGKGETKMQPRLTRAVNPDGPEAAEAISSLLKRVGEAEQVIASSLDALADGCPWAAEVTLQAYLEAVAAALNSDAPLSIGEGDRG